MFLSLGGLPGIGGQQLLLCRLSVAQSEAERFPRSRAITCWIGFNFVIELKFKYQPRKG